MKTRSVKSSHNKNAELPVKETLFVSHISHISSKYVRIKLYKKATHLHFRE